MYCADCLLRLQVCGVQTIEYDELSRITNEFSASNKLGLCKLSGKYA